MTPHTLSGLLVVAAPLCLLGAGAPRPPGGRWWPPLGAAAALIGWALLSSLWSVAPADSLVQAAKLVGWLALGLTLVLTVAQLDGPAGRRAETALLAGCAVGLALLLVEALADQPLNRLVAATGLRTPNENAPNRGATTLALLLGPALTLLWRRGRRGAALVVAPLAMLAVLTLNSFAALAGLCGGLAALVLVASLGRRAMLVIAALFAALVLAAPALHLSVLQAPDPDSPLRNILPRTSQFRLVAWEFAAKRTLERPVAGFGLRAYRHLERRYERGEFPYRPAFVNTALDLSHPHNVAVQVWLELGAVGALLLALLVLALFSAAAAAEVPRPVAAGRAAALATYLIVGLSAYGAEQSQWVATAWLLAAALAVPATGGGAASPTKA